MSTDPFVEAMKRAHPEKKYTGETDQIPKITSIYTSKHPSETVIHRDVLAISSDLKANVANMAALNPNISVFNTIVEVTCYLSGYQKSLLKSDQRYKRIVYWRQVTFWLLRKHTNRSFYYIGSKFNRDHSTVVHACQKIDRDFEKYRLDIEKAESFL